MAQAPAGCGSSASSWISSPAASPKRSIPDHDIRIENFRDTRLPEGSIDAVIGNVPFADLKLDYHGQKLLPARLLLRQVARRPEARRRAGAGHHALHARQAERRHPRVSRRTGPISSGRSACPPTPSSGKARPSSPTSFSCGSGRRVNRRDHVDPDWLEVGTARSSRERRCRSTATSCSHPEMVLGTWSRKDTLYGGEGFQRHRQRRPGRATPHRGQPPAGICDRRKQHRRRFQSAVPFTPPPPLATSPKAASSSATTASSARSRTAEPCRSSTAATASEPTAR